MHIALITADPLPSEAWTERIEFPVIAGRSILRHQLELVLRFGCEHLICLAEESSPEVEQLRQTCSRAGASFRLLHRAQDLCSVVSANDRILVLAKNVLLEEGMLSQLNREQPVIMALPAGGAIALGFERIDATRAWAGVMLLPGSLVEELRRLPNDIDPASTLLRLALMAGTPILELPVGVLTRQAIALPLDGAGVRRIESERIARWAVPVSFAAPCRALLERLTVRHAPRLLAVPFGAPAMAGAAGATLLLALMMGQAGYTGTALAAFIFSYATITAWHILRRVSEWIKPRRPTLLVLGVDAAANLTLVVILAQAEALGASILAASFAPLVLVGLLACARLRLPQPFATLASDRALLGGMLLLANGVGVLPASVMILALIVLATLCVYETRRMEITTD